MSSPPSTKRARSESVVEVPPTTGTVTLLVIARGFKETASGEMPVVPLVFTQRVERRLVPAELVTRDADTGNVQTVHYDDGNGWTEEFMYDAPTENELARALNFTPFCGPNEWEEEDACEKERECAKRLESQTAMTGGGFDAVVHFDRGCLESIF